jgi:CRP-like cAMP-binding protein
MISPELLRRYPFFGFLNDSQLKSVAMISEEVSARTGEQLFEGNAPADALYFLEDGGAELHFVVVDPINTKLRKDLVVGEINPGEIFGIAALIEPYRYTAAVRLTRPSTLIRVDARKLRGLCDGDTAMAYGLMKEVAKAAMERLGAARVQLASEPK